MRMVDLKKAIVKMEIREAAGVPAPAVVGAIGRGAVPRPTLELELHLDHPEGQVANPRVILEQLFRLPPEEQARVRVIRTALLDEDGRPVSLV